MTPFVSDVSLITIAFSNEDPSRASDEAEPLVDVVDQELSDELIFLECEQLVQQIATISNERIATLMV